jgi:hypothetical protein
VAVDLIQRLLDKLEERAGSPLSLVCRALMQLVVLAETPGLMVFLQQNLALEAAAVAQQERRQVT